MLLFRHYKAKIYQYVEEEMKYDLNMRKKKENTHEKRSSGQDFCNEDSDSEREIGKCESERTSDGKAIEEAEASNSDSEDEDNSEEDK